MEKQYRKIIKRYDKKSSLIKTDMARQKKVW